MKKKILFYTTFLTQGGGIEVVTVRYMKKFLKEGYEVDLYVDYNMGEENIREKEIDKKIKIKYLKSEKLSKLIYRLRTLGKAYKIYNIPMYLLIVLSDYLVWKKEIKVVEKANYDITITFFQYLPSYITKIKGPKHQIYLHGSVTRFFDGIRKYFKKSFFKKLEKFDEICTVSQEMGNELIKLAPYLKEKQKTVYNPIDVDEIQKKALDDSELTEEERVLIKSKYICSVGRLDEVDKDFTTLIKAFGELKIEEKIKEKLIIVGDGPDRRKLEKLVEDLKIKDVIFLGKKLNPYIWMKNSKLFVLSSKYEGFGLVLLEALLVGTKVISSNCPVGPKEILANGKYGELFEVGNIEELKSKIKYLQ
ncbi:Probable poly(glycerol-phosphate) alpha-glucosyltransferase [Fusobacterium necrogenes]|uniref:Probable poly(Glycerol-phosphate) alpha-glucosyltransferase n=1 Tax=Fusobacterium necrogenes TaxID=858 RepID=A0A377GVF3_9FUSO|nr:glycosyltransferase [Fusobacterium necrogenes]STO30823.1 Probable poly(glycerol-phosphate) alpha-glucosyltransferase [Fusobacterium necrogenes]